MTSELATLAQAVLIGGMNLDVQVGAKDKRLQHFNRSK